MGDRTFPDPIFDDTFAAKYGLPPGTQITGPPISGTLLSKTPDGRQGPLLRYNGSWPPPKAEEAEGPPPPPRPAAPSPPPPEIVPEDKNALAVSLTPDVCRAPNNPCPFPVWGKGDDKVNYSPDVFANGLQIKHNQSLFSCCFGDEPGIGLGCQSGTVGDVVRPLTSSPILFVNGNPVQRHADMCTMNNGNTTGEYIFVQSTAVHDSPDATDDEDKAWYDGAQQAGSSFWAGMKSTSDEAALLDGALSKAGEWIDDPSRIGSDLQDAYESIPTGEEIWQGAQNIGSGALHVGEQVINDPLGSAQAAGDWVADSVDSTINTVQEGYEKHGAWGAAGAGVGAIASIFTPGKKIRAVADVGDALEDVGDVAGTVKKADNLENVVDGAHSPQRDVKGENNSGEHGGRVTARLEVRCFDLPRNVDRDEFRRQLKEQQATINQMTADDMAYAQRVLDQAREQWGDRPGSFTNLLRDGKAQDAARADYRRSLEEANLSEEEITAELDRVNATHYLDIIAGGDPSLVGIGGGAENQRIGPMWTQHGRVDSMKDAANGMKANGQADSLMNVVLWICGEDKNRN